MRNRTACLLFVLGGFAAQTSTLPELRTAAATITPGNLLRHIRELSSDEHIVDHIDSKRKTGRA